MKASDYIAEFFIKKGINDIFGYPGGMITHLMDSVLKYPALHAHICCHEQGAAFEACGYAQATEKPGVAYATSGPGATNLITGICNAYFDSIPVIFITGQVNTYESRGSMPIRQRGFQETDILSMVQGVTKYARYVATAEALPAALEAAYTAATTGRKGPVLLDIPMNIQRTDIDPPAEKPAAPADSAPDPGEAVQTIIDALAHASRPLLLLGAGLKQTSADKPLAQFLDKTHLPVVTSMIAFDAAAGYPEHYGFIGAYGARAANFLAAKCDLLITLGARLDIRQVGFAREQFAPNARLLRVDIDANEFANPIRRDDVNLHTDLAALLQALVAADVPETDSAWLAVCHTIREKLLGMDNSLPNVLVRAMSELIPANAIITTDVGQNQVWTAQSFVCKAGQKVLFSGGHGAMGYAVPAAIGACCGTHRPVVSLNGDGGFQMNLQELEVIRREHLPIAIVVFNNRSLGMIRHFQQMYFESRYMQTTADSGYSVPPLDRIADAYDMRYHCIRTADELRSSMFDLTEPVLIELHLEGDTFIFPKLRFGHPNQDPEPLLDRNLYTELMRL